MAFCIFKFFKILTQDANLDSLIFTLSRNLILLTFDHLFDFVFNLIYYFKNVKEEFLFNILNITHNFINPIVNSITSSDSQSWFVNLKNHIREKMNEILKRTSKNQEIPNKIQCTQLNDHKNDYSNHSVSQKGEIIQNSIHGLFDNDDYSYDYEEEEANEIYTEEIMKQLFDLFFE
jgi:hypothetical protein